MHEPPASKPSARTPAHLLVPACLFALYVIWGSTYFAIRVAMNVLPPFLTAGPRYLVAGALLFGFVRLRGAPLPTRRQCLAGAGVGMLLLVLGNGLVVLAQRSVATGVAATVVATMPLWASLFSAVLGDRPTARDLGGLGLGFCGTVVLESGGNLSFTSVDTWLLVLAPVAWALGSVLSRRLPLAPGLMSTAVQMLFAGAAMMLVSVLRGEHLRAPLDAATVGAVLYLVVFGSLIAFSAYGYLLRTVRPALATSYAYVNPVVALVIGAVLGGEGLTATKLVASFLTITGVVVVTVRPRTPRKGSARRAGA